MTSSPPGPNAPPTQNKSNLDNQWGQKILYAMLRFTPLGGSGLALVSFFKDQEWAQAVLMFPFAVVAAIWAGYSKAFLEEVGKQSEDRGKDHASGFMKRVDRVFVTLAKPESKYLECQRRDCVYNDIEGYEQRNVLLLRDVFVPLKLTQGGLESGPMGSRRLEELDKLDHQFFGRDDLTIWDLLRQVRKRPAYARLVIQANGGFGKTTLLRHITYSYATKRVEKLEQFKGVPKLVPVLLYLRKWRSVIAPEDTEAVGPDLPELITKYHLPELPGGDSFQMPGGWAKELLTKGNALVLLDGFDEVAESQRNQVSQWINSQMRKYPKSVFMLTSRPGGYQHYQGKDSFKSTVFVQPFKKDQWKSFIRQWYVCQERARRVNSEENLTTVKAEANKKANQLIKQIDAPERSDLADMVTNPLLLNMITTWHQFRPGGKLPRYRAELYQSICELQLGSRPEAKQVELILPVKESQRILQWLALKMQTREVTQVSETGLLNFFAEALKGLDCPETIKPDRFLAWMCQVSELLVERNTQEYEFSHRSFQSYLAAVEIGQRSKGKGLLDQWNKKQDWWHETIILYVAQLDNPNPAIQGLVDRKAVDLAYKCVQETSKRIDPKLQSVLNSSVKAQVQDLRFEALENYLKTGDLEQADQETYRLMIKTVGKEEGDYFTEEELLNFPCEELLRIDDLWLKYSNGKFGFSVQKQIYVECGAKLDGKYPGQKIYYRFCYRIGWRNNSSWVGVTYGTQSPTGHLPYFVLRGHLHLRVSSLASRFANCKP
ncbi:MAG: GUN4 domain-containing protein [Cyanobacteria bacterium P01_F01_bin.150]